MISYDTKYLYDKILVSEHRVKVLYRTRGVLFIRDGFVRVVIRHHTCIQQRKQPFSLDTAFKRGFYFDGFTVTFMHVGIHRTVACDAACCAVALASGMSTKFGYVNNCRKIGS